MLLTVPRGSVVWHTCKVQLCAVAFPDTLMLKAMRSTLMQHKQWPVICTCTHGLHVKANPSRLKHATQTDAVPSLDMLHSMNTS